MVLIGAWLLLRLDADRAWPGTLLMFAPRWPWVVPVVVMLIVATCVHRRSVPLVLIAGAIAVGPLTHLRLKLTSHRRATAGTTGLRVLTCNVHDTDLQYPALERLIEEEKPDLMFFQEWHWKYSQSRFPAPHWHTSWANGQLLVSRFPIRSTRDYDAWVTYELDTPWGMTRVYNVHFASPHGALRALLKGDGDGLYLLEANILDRDRESGALRKQLEPFPPNVIIAGDFNMPIDSRIYRRDWGGTPNAFSDAGNGLGITYRFRGTSLGIDHILTGSAWHCVRASVLPDVGSPHRPVVADIEFENATPAVKSR
jgi:endonuclease/exonuclease/phosphatase (EEP) superfamily protein YafD